MIETLAQGLLLGGLYCLFALGQSLMFGVMRLTNTALGDFIVLGAFAAIALAAVLPWHPGVLVVLLVPLAFGAGWLLQRHVLNATLGRDPLPSLVVIARSSIPAGASGTYRSGKKIRLSSGSTEHPRTTTSPMILRAARTRGRGFRSAR